MIYDPTAPGSKTPALLPHIEAKIETVGGSATLDAASIEELARAVEHYLGEDHGSEFVSYEMLDMLAAKALESVGETGSARRLILYGSGMVRPSEWVVTGEKAVWILDLKEMTVRDDAPLEMVLFRSIQIAIESIADMWDECRGDGILGLRHVCTSAARLLGTGPAAAAVASLTTEIESACHGKLAQLGRERGWTVTPRVMNLDL